MPDVSRALKSLIRFFDADRNSGDGRRNPCGSAGACCRFGIEIWQCLNGRSPAGWFAALTERRMKLMGQRKLRGAANFPPMQTAQAIYNSRDPSQALSNLEAISTEAAFILKDFHRHMADPVVVRKLRDVGQKFSTNRRTVVITAPSIEVPPELASLVEFLELPLPDKPRLRQMIDEIFMRLGQGHELRRTLEAADLDAMADNLRGLTEEEADRAISHAIVNRHGLTAETVTDVLDAKKDLLRHSGSLEFIDAPDKLAGVGGLG